MERAEKRELVTSLQSSLATAGSIVVARNAGLTVAEMESLRKQMKSAGGQVKVAKNRLAKLALKETDNADISALFTGPVVIAFAQDPMTAPKIAAGFADKNQKFVVLGGAMGKTGLDVVVEGRAARVTDDARLRALAAMWATKHDGEWSYEVRDGAFVHEAGVAHVFEVRPDKVLSFAKGEFAQTRFRFGG